MKIIDRYITWAINKSGGVKNLVVGKLMGLFVEYSVIVSIIKLWSFK